MKKNFFATLIIAALIVVMSFTLTSCDFFNRGNGNNGSGSNGGNSNSGNGGDNGNDGGSVLNGLDASKLSAEAKADKDAQKLALMIGDDYFEALKDCGCIMIREDLANLFSAAFSGFADEDAYRNYYGQKEEEDGSISYMAQSSNCRMYELLKAADVTLEDYSNKDYNGAIDDALLEEIEGQMKEYDESTQTEFFRAYYFNLTGMHGATPDSSELFGVTAAEFRDQYKETFVENYGAENFMDYGDENMIFVGLNAGHGWQDFYFVKVDDNIIFYVYL